MIQFIEGRTIMRARRRGELLVRENPDVSLLGKVFGALGATAFMAAALFFWKMPVDGTGVEADWPRMALCGGLGLIGVMIRWSALYPKKSISQIEVDPDRREIRVGSVAIGRNGEESAFKADHSLPFARVKRFYLGSDTSLDVESTGGRTVLYMEAHGGARKGVTIVGGIEELEPLVGEINAMLAAPPGHEGAPASSPPSSPLQKRGGFGRRGV